LRRSCGGLLRSGLAPGKTAGGDLFQFTARERPALHVRVTGQLKIAVEPRQQGCAIEPPFHSNTPRGQFLSLSESLHFFRLDSQQICRFRQGQDRLLPVWRCLALSHGRKYPQHARSSAKAKPAPAAAPVSQCGHRFYLSN
jgi:hypothetical protein